MRKANQNWPTDAHNYKYFKCHEGMGKCGWSVYGIRGTWLGGHEAVGQGFSEEVSLMLRLEEGGADHMGVSQGSVGLCVKERPWLLWRLARATQLPCSV